MALTRSGLWWVGIYSSGTKYDGRVIVVGYFIILESFFEGCYGGESRVFPEGDDFVGKLGGEVFDKSRAEVHAQNGPPASIVLKE